jgi:hypothetical protein
MTKTEIVTVLNARLKRAETSTTLAEEIRAGLLYVSMAGLWPELHTSSTDALVAGDNSIDKPSGMMKEDKITLNDGTSEDDPLRKVDWDYILKCRSGTPGQSRPYYYTRRGSKFELDAACEQSYTATIYYWQYHPNQTAILFGEQFREAIFNAVMYKYLEGKKLIQEAAYFRAIADSELARLSDTEDLNFSQVKYQDI